MQAKRLIGRFFFFHLVYIPRTQMTTVLVGSWALFCGSWPSKIEVNGVLGIYIYLAQNV